MLINPIVPPMRDLSMGRQERVVCAASVPFQTISIRTAPRISRIVATTPQAQGLHLFKGFGVLPPPMADALHLDLAGTPVAVSGPWRVASRTRRTNKQRLE